MAAQNVLEIVRVGRLAARYGAPFRVAHETSVFKLRHYDHPGGAAPTIPGALILVPPLMVASEVYDIDPEISAVKYLVGRGVDVWLVDFGAPEREEGGMDRTLDDHVRAVSDACGIAREETGHDVHVCGYSQGGMFAYQAAAFRRSAGLSSVITFGSPVDIHRNLPSVRDSFAERMIGALRTVIALPLDRVNGLPGRLTSTGFRVLSARKEVQQFVDFLSKLHDRQALEKRESRRLFMRGGGFVAWPGPALKKFIDEIIVNNRLASGGFVIDGQTVSLADIECPILAFIGLRDDMARPPSVRAIRRAAPNADVYELEVRAGHFGLVVGSTALEISWPTVVEWVTWRAGKGKLPAILPERNDEPIHDEDYDRAFDDLDLDVELAYDVVTKAAEAAWTRVGDVVQELGDTADSLRWQLPRLRKLRRMKPRTKVSIGRALAEQARAIPDRTFFMWKGRAFSYADADRRTEAIVRGLAKCGIQCGHHVGVVMSVRPSYLSLVAALSRIGAVAVLISPQSSDELVGNALTTAKAEHLITDPENAARCRSVFVGEVLVLGGGPKRALTEGVVDLEAIDPDAVKMPASYTPNPGRADDLAMIIFSVGRDGEPRAARITNRRWAFSALGTAAACTLTPKDTVYSCLPLHHATGALVAAGGALVGGSRLALSTGFDPDEFWREIRRYGATVVFYAGEMCRMLVDAPHASADRNNPVRLFAGSGMRADVWNRLVDRFGPFGILEFYATTEGNAVFANAAGEKIGALGRPIPGSGQPALVDYDFDARQLVRSENGRCMDSGVDRQGMLIARIDERHPVAGVDAGGPAAHRIARDVFELGDTWFVTGDIMRRDRDGDFWFVDRAADMVQTVVGPVSTVEIEDALYELPEVRLTVAYGLPVPGREAEMAVAAVVVREGLRLDAAKLLRVLEGSLRRQAWPRFVVPVDEIPMTAGFRPLKSRLRHEGLDLLEASGRAVLRYDAEAHRYVSVDADGFAATVKQLGGNAA